VRRDTALYSLPVATGKRGRPAKYGEKYTPGAVTLLPEVRHWVFLCGKWKWVRYRTAVWMQFEDEDSNLSKPRLLIFTKNTQSADEVFKDYARRWAIEDLFTIRPRHCDDGLIVKLQTSVIAPAIKQLNRSGLLFDNPY
jgi:hypothetical protein